MKTTLIRGAGLLGGLAVVGFLVAYWLLELQSPQVVGVGVVGSVLLVLYLWLDREELSEVSQSRAVRYGTGENLVGYDAIRAFRAARPATGLARTLRNTVITTFGQDVATVMTEFVRDGNPRIGRQSQTWVRFAGVGWRVVAAHVSLL